jgi:UDP-glucose 4-epimerase
MKETILVTGGTGFIGSHTAVELINAGYRVIIADNLSNSKIDVLDGIKEITGTRPDFIQADISDMQQVQSIFAAHKDIKGIIHFAAHKAVNESISQPVKYYRNNCVSLMNILDCTKNAKDMMLVFSSSCTVYGQPDKLPVTEETPLKKALSPYGNTKRICEEIIADAMADGRTGAALSLRYFNPVGAHESALIGELPSGVPDNLMPYITQTAAGIRDSLRIFGDDYSTPDGSCIRDYIHVVDLACAHVAAIDRLIGKKYSTPYEVFNLGTGKGISVLEIVNAFERVTGVKLNYTITKRREGDIEQVWGDTTKANRELGWKTIRTLDDMIVSAWKWEKRIRGLQ